MRFSARRSVIIKPDLDAGESLVRGFGARWHGSVSCCWALVYCCFFALYTPGSPPISGAHWSVKQSKLQSSSSLTASSRPQQAGQRLLPKFSKSKRPPLKTHLFQILDRWTPTEAWRSLVLQEPEGAAVIISGLFMIFVSVLGMRRGNADLFCTWSHVTKQLWICLIVILSHLTENV